MIASLPMYWRDENAEAWRDFWARMGPGLPDLTAPGEIADLGAHWTDPGLVLSMTCGLPFRAALRGRVRYVATPDFGLGDGPGMYHSVCIARPGWDGGAALMAYNAADSQSGWAAQDDADPRNPRPAIRGTLCTGSHAGSLTAVAEGRADLAWIDAVTWRLLQRFVPGVAAQVAVIGRTGPVPGLPLICALDRDPVPLRAAFAAACATLSPSETEALGGLRGIAVLDPARYLSLPIPAPPLH